jgi:hypothetical protein
MIACSGMTIAPSLVLHLAVFVLDDAVSLHVPQGDGGFGGAIDLELPISRAVNAANAAVIHAPSANHRCRFCDGSLCPATAFAAVARLHPIVRGTTIPGNYRQ